MIFCRTCRTLYRMLLRREWAHYSDGITAFFRHVVAFVADDMRNGSL